MPCSCHIDARRRCYEDDAEARQVAGQPAVLDIRSADLQWAVRFRSAAANSGRERRPQLTEPTAQPATWARSRLVGERVMLVRDDPAAVLLAQSDGEPELVLRAVGNL